MNGELAQLIALAAHGSAWLRSERIDDATLDANTTFQYVRHVAFAFDSLRRFRRLIESGDVGAWLRAVKARGVTDLMLGSYSDSAIADGPPLPQHIAVAFNDVGAFALIATRPSGAELWRARWSVGATDRPADNRIWDVEYVGLPTSGSLKVEGLAPSVAQDRLADAVLEGQRFAERQNLDPWVEWFSDALALGESSDPVAPYHPDVLPDDSELPRRQLMAMAVRSWVFGGMGSWNDVWLQDPAERGRYENITRNLYSAVLDALRAATNVRSTQT